MEKEAWELGRPPLGRYAGFVAVTILFALMAMSLFAIASTDASERMSMIMGLPWVFGFLFFWGSPIWVPVFIIALLPGFAIYRGVVSLMLIARLAPGLATASAVITVSLVSSLGIPFGLHLSGNDNTFSGVFEFRQYWPVIFGVPAALFSAYLILYTKEKT
ncbi:MAG: hypothetical protein AB3N21_14830 [Ruegeria sp.]|uniref:hypothetical protein n=1 Tax=Ruegeria sp. TaxID=1879320 RepID=UPI00349ED7A4